MKVYLILASIFLFASPGCQRANSDSSKLDSLRLDSARLADSLSSVSSVRQETPSSQFYNRPQVCTFRETILFKDSVMTGSGQFVPALTPVQILDQTKAMVEDCGAYVYEVQLPALETGWIDGSTLAFPSDFMPTASANLFGADYTIFSLRQGGEITGQECGSAWMVLVFSHSENKIYPVTVTDPETEAVMFGLRMRVGAATLEFYSDMAFPGIETVQANNDLIELGLKIGYMDNTFHLYRLFLEKSDETFNIVRYELEASPDYGEEEVKTEEGN